MRKLLLIFSAALFTNIIANANEAHFCPSAKEFITTKEFLSDRSELGLSEQEIIITAKNVAQGCKGAAARFTKAFTVLLKTESGPRGSLKVAVQLAQRDESYTQAFLEIFRKSYLKEYLDLNFKTAMDMAQSLSVDFKGAPERAASDFVDLVKFCTDEKYLALSKPRCGLIAARVIKNTENFDTHIASSFVDLFEFITSEKGPTPDLLKALEVTERVVSLGPEAPENFKLAYRYAIQDKGLAYTAKDSLSFAMEIGAFAKFNPQEHRLPASEFKTLEDL